MSTIQIVQVTPEELHSHLSKAILSNVAQLKELFAKSEYSELLTRKEVSKLLKVDVSTIYNWTKDGKLKSYGIKGRIYFKRSEIESALTELKTK